MVDYMFEARHHAPLLAGGKLFTLRKDRVKRHARLGEALQLRAGRAKPVFADAECSYRGRILFAERGIVRVLNPDFTLLGERVARLMLAAEQGSPQQAEHLAKVAHADGFESWGDLVRWHAEQGPPDENGLIAREVIGISGVVGRV